MTYNAQDLNFFLCSHVTVVQCNYKWREYQKKANKPIFLLTELLRISTGKTRTLASMSLSPVMNLGLLRSLGLEPCSIALFAFAITTLCFRKKYQWSKLSCIGMVFLDLLRLTSLTVSCIVTLSQDHPTIKAFITRSPRLPEKTKIYSVEKSK